MKPLSKKAIKRIENAVEQYKAFLKLKAIGPMGITREQMRDLIRNGWIKETDKLQAPITSSYLLAHAQTVDNHNKTIKPEIVEDGDKRAEEAIPIVATSANANKQFLTRQQGALNFLDRMTDRYIGKAADQLKTDVLSSVEATLTPLSNRAEGSAVYEALQDKNLHSKNLRNLLTGKVENWEHRWRTIITTELNRATNWGAMDAILTNNPHLDPHEIVVFKQGNLPGHGACKYCAKFWYMDDGVTPRVYKLSELAANGSNIGRKAKDWLPTIDSTHPNESHYMHQLLPGNGFNNGSVTFVGHDHDEYKKQRDSKD